MLVNEDMTYDDINEIVTGLLTPAWFRMRCGKLVRNSKLDGFTLHFHTWGKFRFWRKQVLLESHALERMTVIEPIHATYVLKEAPETWTETMAWLRAGFPEYEFLAVRYNDE